MSSCNIEPLNKETDYSDYIRLVLIGKTGNGKSATANNLIGQKNYFKSGSNQAYVTQHCQAVTFRFNEKKILLVDTPGIADMIRGENFITNEFRKCLELTKPGPHAFIIVLSLASRFTNENINVLEFISKFYGKYVFEHSLILFTGIENLEMDQIEIRDFLIDLRNNFLFLDELINQCHNNYLGVSNRWKTDEYKMIKFRLDCFNMINKMIRDKRDGNEYYTFDQFRAAYKYYEDEKKKIQHEKISEKIKELNENNRELIRKNEQLNYMLKNNIDDSQVLRIRY